MNKAAFRDKATFPQEGRYFEKSDRLNITFRLDLIQHWKLSCCRIERNGTISFEGVLQVDPQAQGFIQPFTRANDEWLIDGIPVDLTNVPFSLINRGEKWYINRLTRDGLLQILRAAQEVRKDGGFIETDHSAFIEWVEKHPLNALDIEITKEWRDKDALTSPVH